MERPASHSSSFVSYLDALLANFRDESIIIEGKDDDIVIEGKAADVVARLYEEIVANNVEIELLALKFQVINDELVHNSSGSSESYFVPTTDLDNRITIIQNRQKKCKAYVEALLKATKI